MTLRILSSLLLSSVFLLPAYAATSPKELLAAGRADQAIQTLEQQVRHSPNDAEAYNLLCRAYFMVEEWDHGITACEHAKNLDPQKSLYHLWLGRVYGEKASRVSFLSAAGIAKKVRVSFERAVELDPKSWEARSDLADFYIEAPGVVGGGKDKARAQADALMAFNACHRRTGSWLESLPRKRTPPSPSANTTRTSMRVIPKAAPGSSLRCFFSTPTAWTKWNKLSTPWSPVRSTAPIPSWTAPAFCCVPAATIPLRFDCAGAISKRPLKKALPSKRTTIWDNCSKSREIDTRPLKNFAQLSLCFTATAELRKI